MGGTSQGILPPDREVSTMEEEFTTALYELVKGRVMRASREVARRMRRFGVPTDPRTTSEVAREVCQTLALELGELLDLTPGESYRLFRECRFL